MALVFGLSPHHPDYKRGVMGKFRSSSAGKSFSAVFLILSYIMWLILPFVPIYHAYKEYYSSPAGIAAEAPECKWSFPMGCNPADACRMRGFRCAPIS